MTHEEIKELRNDLVLLSVAIDQIEDRMHKGLFTNALAIVEEQKDIVNKYNHIDNWLWIKRDDLDCLNKALADYEISSSYKELVKNTHRMRLIIDTCFHIKGDVE